MTCPYLNGNYDILAKPLPGDASIANSKPDSKPHTTADRSSGLVTYSTYLNVDKLLSLNEPRTQVHDEHLFITIHQVYELWFKQILYELDSVCDIFKQPKVDERFLLKVNNRLRRVVEILKILVEQMMILETMTPMDFADFRDKLGSSSGFQSWQFRLLENKLGMSKDNRIKYSSKDYSEVYKGTGYESHIDKSEKEPSIFFLVQAWLERTPGLDEDSFDFWDKFENKCRQWLDTLKAEAEMEQDEHERATMLEAHEKKLANFNQILIPEKYEELRKKGISHRLSWKGLQGALMISFYRDEVVFQQPFQMINLLMDIDSLLTKWRYNHVMLVQRQLGTKIGSGGSSGYQYLRSTVSDRYKVFLDFFNLSNYLIPREYIPPLCKETRQRLASVCMPSFEKGVSRSTSDGSVSSRVDLMTLDDDVVVEEED